MIKIISGGQTGADEGGLYGARDPGSRPGDMPQVDFSPKTALKRSYSRDSGLSIRDLITRGEPNLTSANLISRCGLGTPEPRAQGTLSMP